MSDYQQILFETKDRVTTITLNRPDRLNAWTALMAEEVGDAITRAGDEKESRCIVVTGAGRGFCAGADMGGLQDISGAGRIQNPATTVSDPQFPHAPGPSLGEQFPGRFGYMYRCPKPIIAVINGPCAGIGLIFALFADMRFADEGAKFTTAFAARGLIAEHGIAWLLPRLIGEAKALDLLFTARKFNGTEAADMGLVNKALPSNELQQHVSAIAKLLANDVSPRSVAIMKRQIRASYAQSFAESLEVADAEMNASFSTFDFKEGVQSYVEKRTPAFENI